MILLRKYVKTYLKGWSHCISYNTWCTQKSELYSSCRITTPFYIMNLDIRSTGKIFNYSGKPTSLLTILTRFSFLSLLDQLASQSVDTTFVEDVVLLYSFFQMFLLMSIANSMESLRNYYEHLILLSSYWNDRIIKKWVVRNTTMFWN